MNINTSSTSILDEIGYAYFEINLAGTFTLVNGFFCQALGYDRDELVGQHYRLVTDPDRISVVLYFLETILQSGLPLKSIEFPFRKRDGTIQFAEGALALVRDAAGQPAGFRAILHDVTERKRAELALQQAKQAAERELEIGRRIQSSFLPEELPQPPGWQIARHFQAARVVAGDFYDAFTLSGGKRLGLVVADVTDKGVGAAMFMALFRSLIRAFADQHYSLGWMDVLSHDLSATPGDHSSVGRRRSLLSTGTTALKNAIDLTNNYITRIHGRSNMFATVFFGVLDPATGALIYINGGQEPPLVIAGEAIKQMLEPTGPAVGLLPGMEFNIGQIELEPGDTLLAYTDGVIDANNPAGNFYGEDRLFSVVQQPVESAQSLVNRIRLDLEMHIGGADPYDDITMLAVHREPLVQA